MSKARIVEYYRTVVGHDLLPAPFNLVQLALSLLVFVVVFLVEAAKVHRADRNRQADPEEDPDGRIFWGKVEKGARPWQSTASQVFGRMVFCLVLGPVAVTGGAILWVLSGFIYAPFVLYKFKDDTTVHF